MPTKLCYFGCKLDVPMHRFPKPNYNNEVRFNMWLAVLSVETKLKGTSYILGNLYISDRHFEQNFRMVGKRLTANSYPSLNLSQQYRDLDSDNSGTASSAEGTVSTVSSVINIQTQISHATGAFPPKVSPPSPLSAAERYEELIKSSLGDEPLLNACAIKESPPRTPVSTADYNKIFISDTLDNEPHFNASTSQMDPLDVGLKEDVSAKIDPEDIEIATTFSCIGIRNSDLMSDEQMQSVHYALNRAIMKIGRKEAGPRFTGFIHMQGWILVNCANQVSQDWIVQKIDNLKPWPQAELSVIPEDELPQVQVGTIFVPRSEAESPEEGFQLLRAQNDGLNTELWTILQCRDQVHGFLVTLSLDNPSADAIRKKGCIVALGFKFVTFKIYGKSYIKYESDLNRY
ncbi:unnamed protein product [Parnassius mnemosyne]|uniref:DUF4780 domain-containing protein n=1 Tax=Parnassius mnemosyne TaxID=213953 RepID=A0AAV1KZS8_9NEOP